MLWNNRERKIQVILISISHGKYVFKCNFRLILSMCYSNWNINISFAIIHKLCLIVMRSFAINILQNGVNVKCSFYDLQITYLKYEKLLNSYREVIK